MKKILFFLGLIVLIGINIINLIACNKVTEYIYSSEELIKLKEKNKIKTNNQEIINNLEWIAPQEKPFNKVDNKYYFIAWRGNENYHWRIVLFKFENTNITNIDQYNKYIIFYSVKQGYNSGLILVEKLISRNILIKRWEDDNKQKYFKFLYRWNNDSKPNISIKNKLKIHLNL